MEIIVILFVTFPIWFIGVHYIFSDDYVWAAHYMNNLCNQEDRNEKFSHVCNNITHVSYSNKTRYTLHPFKKGGYIVDNTTGMIVIYDNAFYKHIEKRYKDIKK